MQLENLYPRDFKKSQILDRKVTIDSKKLYIYGVKNSGKTSILINYLKSLKKESFLYIDFEDFRVNTETLENDLFEFLKRYNIETLAIDNFDFSISLPEIESIILTSNRYQKIENFRVQKLYPLDFEEYLLFNRKAQDTISAFNQFIKDGTFPEIALTPEYQRISKLQSIILTFCKSEFDFYLLRELINHSGYSISNFQIYNSLKRLIKASKDRVYSRVKEFELEGIIYFIDKFNSNYSNRKLYMVDFTLKGVVNFNKNFKKEFENMLFLNLLKRNREIFYLENIEFYIPSLNLATLAMPFASKESILEKLNSISQTLKGLNLTTLKIVTLNFALEFKFENIYVEVVEFHTFATGDLEVNHPH